MEPNSLESFLDEMRLEVSAPEYNNSAGRLIVLLQALAGTKSYYDNIAIAHGGSPESRQDAKVRVCHTFLNMVGETYEELLNDVANSPRIKEAARDEITRGLRSLQDLVYPMGPSGVPRGISSGEMPYLRLAATLLDQEQAINEDELNGILDSIESLTRQLGDSRIDPNAREALMDLMRHARFAVDYYRIYGAKGFRTAFKRMIGELWVLLNDEGQEIKEKTWWSNVKELLRRVDKAASKFEEHRPLIEAAGRLLLGGQGA
jgi:hypothetical protein